MKQVQARAIGVPTELKPLVDEIRARLKPDSIWLFGSRARGDHRPGSDWDLLVALPDNADPDLLDPMVGWSIQRDVGLPATILTTTVGALEESWGSPNTIGYDLARYGRRLHEP
ncbi:MAG: nucleotidyltransferase domain-containing protein [Rhizobiaceae bacterium]|nr:nucleotidyltransferase domain-containing protein [Rhizobiaceae bacterium]